MFNLWLTPFTSPADMLLMQAVHQPAVGVHVVDAALLGICF